MRRKWLLVLFPIAALILVVLAIRMDRRAEIPLATARSGQFVISITRSGEIRALRSLTVTAPSAGERPVITRLIPEGTFVEKGDILVEFDPTELLNRLDSAERDLVAARAEVGLTAAKNELRRRELLDDIRRKEIAIRKAEGQSPVEQENARQDLELARARYETEVKVMEAEALKTEISISRAEERLRSEKEKLEALTIKSPGDGIVIHEKVWRSGSQVKVQEGDSPWPMQPIISLPDLNTLYVATDIDETDIGRVELSDSCSITLEAYPDTAFAGGVSKIGNLARRRFFTGGPNVFDVSVNLDSLDDRLRPGMKARVEIVVDLFGDRVSVPIEAVFEREGGMVVHVRRSAGFEEVDVTTGPRNDTHVVILEGLEGGEKVALLDPAEDIEG
jgi:RND family efflux transporter MFP subunit